MKKYIFIILSAILITGWTKAQTTDNTNQIQALKAEKSEEIKLKREELKVKIENKAKEVKDAIEANKEKLKKVAEQRKTQLQQKLKNIKDVKKKQAVENVNDKILELNDRTTNHFLDVLTKLERALNNISSRIEKAEASGLAVSSAKTAIVDAQKAIDESKQAVKVQAEKIYSISITTENNLKVDVGKTRQSLHTDLKAVFETVKKAREAVHKTATTLAQIPKIKEIKTESSNADNSSKP